MHIALTKAKIKRAECGNLETVQLINFIVN